MYLSKHPTNRIYYLWFLDELGHKQKVSTKCKLKSDALKFLQDFKQKEHEQRVRLQRTSLSLFKEDYLKQAKSNRTASTQEVLEIALRVFLRFVGDIPLHRIGVREVEAFLAHRKAEGCSDYTVRFYYVALASAFETAKRWNLVASNPFRLVEKPKTPELQPVHFTKDEFRTLIETIEDEDFKELCICAVSTGVRLSELTSLQWTDIDLLRKVLHVRNSDTFTTKTRKNRIVPMNELLWQMLALRKEKASCEIVFHRDGRRFTKDEISKRFKKHARQAFGLTTKLHFHSLRHTFASWLVEDGVSLYEVQKLLGHSNISVTEIYSHLKPEQLHNTVNRINLVLN